MAYNVSFRVLMFLLAVVVILNFSQFLLNTKKTKEPRYPAAFMDKDNTNAVPMSSTDLYDDTFNLTCPMTEANLDDCPEIPPDLGIETNASESVVLFTDWLQMGGIYRPRHCKPRQKVAVIIPFSGKHEELTNFTRRLHYFLIKQEAEYQIFVVEYGNKTIPFNRGHLSNVAFLEIQKQHSRWQCVVLHPARLMPTDSRNLYRCGWYPRQMVGEVQYLKPLINGLHNDADVVISITPRQYYKMNGYSNQLFDKDELYFSDFLNRIQWQNYTLERSGEAVSKYIKNNTENSYSTTTPLVSETPASTKTPPGNAGAPNNLANGLSTLVYDLDSVDTHSLYTLIRVSRPIAAKTTNSPNLLSRIGRLIQQ